MKTRAILLHLVKNGQSDRQSTRSNAGVKRLKVQTFRDGVELMVQFMLPKNSKITAGKTWPRSAGAQNPREFRVYRWISRLSHLPPDGGLDVCESRNVATGARQARDEARAYRVADDRKHDRDSTGRSVQCCRHRRGRAEDNVGLRPDELRRESARAVGVPVCPPLLEPHVAAVRQPNRASSSTKAAKKSPVSLSDDPISTPMRRTFRLAQRLSAVQTRMSADRASECRNKFASVHRGSPRISACGGYRSHDSMERRAARYRLPLIV